MMRKVLLVLGALGIGTLVAQTARESPVLILIAAREFDYREYQAVAEVLNRAGLELVTTARDTGIARAMNDSLVRIDLPITAVEAQHYSGLVVLGGVGSVLYWDDLLVNGLVRQFASVPGAVLAGIGLGPITLAKAGVLKARLATVYPDLKALKLLEAGGARFRNTDVVRDRNIITATGHRVGVKFARELVRALRPKEN